MAFNDSSCFQPACPDLSVQIQDAPSIITGDQFSSLSFTVSNTDDSQAAAVLRGTSLLRTTFSQPVGYRRADAPGGYECGVQVLNFIAGQLNVFPDGPVPQTMIECTALVDDSIPAGGTRAFTLHFSPPSAIREPSDFGRLRATVQLDPDGVIANDPDASETAAVHFSVGPSTLIQLAPDAQTQPGTQAAAVFQKSSLFCSDVHNVSVNNVVDFQTTFGPHLGSMTCAVSLRPADAQTGHVEIAPNTIVLILQIDGLQFHSLASRPGFKCFGATNSENSPEFHALKIYCVTTTSVEFNPGQVRSLLSFSSWLSAENEDVDWSYCPYPFIRPSDLGTANLTNQNPVCGLGFGGSASSD